MSFISHYFDFFVVTPRNVCYISINRTFNSSTHRSNMPSTQTNTPTSPAPIKAASGQWISRGGLVTPYKKMTATQLRAAIRTATSRALKSTDRTEALLHLSWADEMKNSIADGRYAGAPRVTEDVIKKPVYGEKTETQCECGCEKSFTVRVADMKRGWGKFYSKSCAQRSRHAEQHAKILEILEALPVH
jgi:hypothetical protein